MPSAKCRLSAGFTLVEMLVATVLAASVVVAALGVLRRFAQEVRAERTVGNVPVDELAALIEADLFHAEQLELSNGSLAIVGHLSLDPDTRELTHRPAEVSYEVRLVNERSWLFRRETVQEGPGQVRQVCEPVCAGVTRLAIEPLAPSPGADTPATGTASPAGTRAMGPLREPAQTGSPYRLTVEFDRPLGPGAGHVLTRTLVLR